MRMSSLKKLQELHRSLGGNAKGYYLTAFGYDRLTGKSVSVSQDIAYHTAPSHNWSTHLVKGKLLK